MKKELRTGGGFDMVKAAKLKEERKAEEEKKE